MYSKAADLAEAYEYVDAVKTYKSILKKCKDTKIAEHARTAAKALIDAGKPGYKPSCENCRKKKGSACPKHAEKMKL